MPVDSAARICRSMMHSSSSSRVSGVSSTSSMTSFRRHSPRISQHGEKRAQSSQFRKSPPPMPGTIDSADVVAHLRKTFPPLEFPADVAQRMTTHISWNRGIDGHNGRLGFIGRRVLHTYLLLFLHECSLPPQGCTHPKNASSSTSSRLRHSVLSSGTEAPSEAYDDISERLLNTYVLGEHVGGAWQLERVMRWTPAVAELDTVRAASPQAVLRSSGLYKVRGATVEGVVGGIFHQFGGAIAHRVFHTRVLPHILPAGLPIPLRARAEEACERLGGTDGLLINPSVQREGTRQSFDERHSAKEHQESIPEGDRLKDIVLDKRRDAELTKLNTRQISRERQKLGFGS